MADNPTDDPGALPASRVLPGPAELRHYPAYNLVAWRPTGVLDDRLLDEIGEWLCHIEKAAAGPFERFVDLSRITNVAVRTNHVFDFARKRTEQFAGAPVRSALFSEDWVCFGIARMYEGLMVGTSIDARAFRDRVEAAIHLGVPPEILKLADEPAPPR
jgi:hypothetical protein